MLLTLRFPSVFPLLLSFSRFLSLFCLQYNGLTSMKFLLPSDGKEKIEASLQKLNEDIVLGFQELNMA